MQGLVMKSTGSWHKVLANDDKIYECRLPGRFKVKGEFGRTNPIAVGDKIELDPKPDPEGKTIITNILPRENFMTRKAVKQSSQRHYIAANIDQVMVVVTMVVPKTSLGFIDRILVAAESFRIPSIIVFNKKDLIDDKIRDEQDQIASMYENTGSACFSISATRKEGLEEIDKVLEGKVTLLTGHSGVGKSTLLNALSPDIEQKIGEVSEWSLKGKHVTSFAEMFKIRPGTFVIDTPGIKEFGLVDIEGWELSDYFPEMRALRGECKYYNCTHVHEPGCVVKRSVEDGHIARNRYNSYLSMMKDEDNRR